MKAEFSVAEVTRRVLRRETGITKSSSTPVSTGHGQNWQIFQHEGQWHSDPAGQALKEQMQSGPASLRLEQAGFQKLVYESKSGELVGTSTHVIQAGLNDSLSDISKTISNQPVPTSDQFKAQLDLLAWIAKQQQSASMQNH